MKTCEPMKTMGPYEQLYNDLRNLAIEYIEDEYHGTDDDSVEGADNDDFLQAIDTICDYLEDKDG